MKGNYRRGAQVRRKRSHFIFKSYFVFVTFLLLSIGQYILILNVDDLSRFLVDRIELILTFMFMSLILLTIFLFVENVRDMLPLNWILALIIVEGFVFGVSRSMVNLTWEVLVLCFVFVTILVVSCICLATFLPHDLTLDVIVISVVSFIFFIAAVYFVMLFAVANVKFSLYIYSALVIIILCLFLMYHSQTINGGRYAEMHITDHILASLILYIDFKMLLMVSLYFMPTIWDLIKPQFIHHRNVE